MRFKSDHLSHNIQGDINRPGLSLPVATIKNALCSTAAEGFQVVHTANTTATVEFLASITRCIADAYSGFTVQEIASEDRMTYEDFSARTKKKVERLSDLFALQLMMIPRISSTRARAIIDKYPTFSALEKAWNELPDIEERKRLLAPLKTPGGRSSVGPQSSAAVYEYYH